MNATVSYINQKGEVLRPIIPEDLADVLVTFDAESSVYFYTHPITKMNFLLSSIADNPCFCEDFDHRKHWMWKGKMHRTSGPAFDCDQNSEWYAFGHPLEEEDFLENQEYLIKLEQWAEAHGVDLHGQFCDTGIPPSQYFLGFEDAEHVMSCAREGVVPLFNRDKGIDYHPLDQLIEETRGLDISTTAKSGSGALLALLGVAAAVAATQFATKKETKVITKSATVAVERGR